MGGMAEVELYTTMFCPYCVRARALLERSRRLLDQMNAEDREEAIALHEQIEDALRASQWERLRQVTAELANLLFYVEES